VSEFNKLTGKSGKNIKMKMVRLSVAGDGKGNAVRSCGKIFVKKVIK